MSELFYCPEILASGITLQTSEAHHAINVLRMKQHDTIRLFNGNGTTAEGRIERLTRREVMVEVLSIKDHQRPGQHQVIVAAAVPKGDRLKWMVEKLTELGVDRFVPLQTKRSVVQPGSSKLDKLQATVINAAKQSRNLWMMQLAAPIAFSDLLAQQNTRFLLAHPSATASLANSNADATQADTTDASQTILIGPEGGFTDAEVEVADQKNCRRLAWSGGILRIETAAVTFAAIMIMANRKAISGEEPSTKTD